MNFIEKKNAQEWMCQNGLTVYIDFHVVIYLSLVTNALQPGGLFCDSDNIRA